MNNNELVNKAMAAAKDFKTTYANGMFGSPISESIVAQKAVQLPGWYTPERQAYLRSIIGKGYYGFDCICFIKGLLWGWNGDASKIYGGAAYASNGVLDINESEMLNKCSGVGSDFTRLEVGEYLYIDGHCGLYAGDGFAVECTSRWNNGVQVTAVLNVGAKAGYNGRTWAKHGKLPYINYISDVVPSVPSPSGKTITVTLDTLRQGERRGDAQIATVQRVLKLMGYYTMDIDSSFGPGTLNAVKAFQATKGLTVDGVIGVNTWTALLK